MVELAIVRNFPPPDQPELALRAEDFIFADSPALAVPAPTVEDATFSVDENSLEGTIVDTVVATDIEITDYSEDSDRLTYEIISGNPDPDVDGTSAFSIDAETGAITVTDSGDLDFESSPNTFTLTVRVTDLEGLTDSATVTINLTDVNEAPEITENGPFTIDENSAVNTVVGTVIATDPDADDTISYTITAGNDAGAFAIDAATGAITVTDSGPLDFETTPSFDLTVEVTDSGDLTAESTVAINLTDINQENVAPVEGLQREDFMLVAPGGLQFTNVSVTDDFNGDGTPDDLNDPTSLGFAFLNGFLNYTIELEPGRRELDISIILPPNTDFNTYYKFGPTPDNSTPRLYEFTYDGQTGAEFFNLEDGITLVVLHFIDGQRGDNDRTVNGVIVNPGAPGVGANLPAPSLEREGESFTINGTNRLVVPLNFTLTKNESAFVNEIGVFRVDDASNRGEVIFSEVDTDLTGLSRSLQFSGGDRLRFYLETSNEDTFFSFSAANDNNEQVRVSQSGKGFTLAWEDTNVDGLSFGGDFNDLVIDVELQNSLGVNQLVAIDQEDNQRELLDLTQLPGDGTARFTVNREAALDNFVGFYQIDDEQGRNNIT